MHSISNLAQSLQNRPVQASFSDMSRNGVDEGK